MTACIHAFVKDYKMHDRDNEKEGGRKEGKRKGERQEG